MVYAVYMHASVYIILYDSMYVYNYIRACVYSWHVYAMKVLYNYYFGLSAYNLKIPHYDKFRVLCAVDNLYQIKTQYSCHGSESGFMELTLI